MILRTNLRYSRMEHKDLTKLIVKKIVRRRPYYKLTMVQVMWIWKRYMQYMAISLAYGTQVKMSTRLQFVLGFTKLDCRGKEKQKRRLIGIKTIISGYFRFHVMILGRFEKMGYTYRPTKWMHKKIKEVIDIDSKLEIIPQQ